MDTTYLATKVKEHPREEEEEESLMAKLGTIGEFCSDREDWSSYTERLESYFTASEVTDATKKTAYLLSGCGAQTYQLIRNLCSSSKPAEKSYDEVVKLVRDHYSPCRSEIVQRFKFNSRSHQVGETIASFVAELQKL